MKRLSVFIILFLITQITPAFSKGLDEYLAILDNHPSIQTILLEKESFTYQAEGALGLPDPVLAIGVENLPVSDPSFNEFLPSSKTIGFSQNIPNFSRRNAQKKFLLQSAHNQALIVDYNRSRLHALFYTSLAQHRRIKAEIALEGEKQEVLHSLKDFYEGEVVAGSPTFQKIFSVDLQLSEREKRINDLETEKQVVEAVFLRLVQEVPQPLQFDYPEKEWLGEQTVLHPVLLAEENIDLAQKNIDIADADFSPDFGVSATYKIREEGQNQSFSGDDWFSVQLRMTVPLWSSVKQQPNLEAARSKKRSAEYKYKDVYRLWAMQMATIFSKKSGSLKNLKILTRKEEILSESIATLERTYGSGESSLEPVLIAELNRLKLRAQILREQEAYIRSMQEANSHIK